MPNPSFHKLIVPSIIQEKQLRIPEVFLRKFRDELSALATLAIPDGNVWQIGLRKADNKVWFHGGWQNFVERYCIRAGYLLVFRYQRNSCFHVHIFNLAASEINYQSIILSSPQGPYFANQCHIFEEMEDEDIDLLDSSLTCMMSGALQNKVYGGSAEQLTSSRSYDLHASQNLFMGSKLDCINWADGTNLHMPKAASDLHDNQSTRDIGVQFNEVEFKRSADEVSLQASNEGKRKAKGRKKRKTDPSTQLSSPKEKEEEEEEAEGEMRFRFYESASARKRTVTAEERERALNAAKAFEPLNPFCRVVLRPSYLYRGCIMYLPSCFAEKHLNGVSGFIKLQSSDGRQWPVRCLYRSGRAKLSQGWYEFTLENNIGEGDVCVFELLKMKDVVLHVTVFRVVQDAAGMLNSPLQQNVPRLN